MEPTLNRVPRDGQWVWEVTYNGIARYHSQDWQAAVQARLDGRARNRANALKTSGQSEQAS